MMLGPRVAPDNAERARAKQLNQVCPARTVVVTRSERGVRNETNEDAYLVLENEGFIVVLDGIGGHCGGFEASRLALQEIYLGLRGAPIELNRAYIEDIITNANRAVYRQSLGKPRFRGMGCTLCAAWVREGELTVFHVGDSRAYRMRNACLERLTTDHAVHAHIGDGLGKKTHRTNKITRALGAGFSVQVEVNTSTWRPADVLMLTTDGITDILTDDQICDVIVDGRIPLGERVNRLFGQVQQCGGDDDCTVVLLQG